MITVADAGYWNDVVADEHIQGLIPPDSGKRDAQRRETIEPLLSRA